MQDNFKSTLNYWHQHRSISVSNGALITVITFIKMERQCVWETFCSTMGLYLCGLLCCPILLLILFILYINRILGIMEVIPKLYYKESDLTKHLLIYCKSLNVSFRPKHFISHCYIQTLIGYFKPPIKDITFTREYIQMDDRGIIALDWHKNSKMKIRKGCSILIIFPRLTGDALSVSQICVMAAKKGTCFWSWHSCKHSRVMRL